MEELVPEEEVVEVGVIVLLLLLLPLPPFCDRLLPPMLKLDRRPPLEEEEAKGRGERDEEDEPCRGERWLPPPTGENRS